MSAAERLAQAFQVFGSLGVPSLLDPDHLPDDENQMATYIFLLRKSFGVRPTPSFD